MQLLKNEIHILLFFQVGTLDRHLSQKLLKVQKWIIGVHTQQSSEKSSTPQISVSNNKQAWEKEPLYESGPDGRDLGEDGLKPKRDFICSSWSYGRATSSLDRHKAL